MANFKFAIGEICEFACSASTLAAVFMQAASLCRQNDCYTFRLIKPRSAAYLYRQRKTGCRRAACPHIFTFLFLLCRICRRSSCRGMRRISGVCRTRGGISMPVPPRLRRMLCVRQDGSAPVSPGRARLRLRTPPDARLRGASL